MYQQTQFDPALLSLMQVAKRVTPQGGRTVADSVMAKAGVPPQEMPPGAPQGMPPGMPPQGPPQQGLPDLLQQAQQAAPSVAQNMQEQQNAQMLAQAQPQPPMMAEGGIASLPIDDYEYADGGIIGYAGPNGSEVNFGGVSGIPYYSPGESEERERLNRLPLDVIEKLIEAMRVGGKRLVRGTTFDPLTKRTEASDEAKLFQNLDLINAEKATQSEPAPSAPPSQPERAAERPPVIRPEGVGIAGVAPRQNMGGAESMYRDQLKAIEEQRKGIQAPRSIDQILQEELAARRARGLPEDPSQLAKQQLSGIEAIDAERQAMMAAQKAPRLQAGMLEGLLAPGAMNLGQLFAGSARGIMKAEEAGRVADIEGLDKKRAVTVANNAIREAIQRAEYAELEGDMATAKAEREKAEAIKQALFTAQQTLTTGRRGEVAAEDKEARNRATQLQIARIQAEARLNPAATDKQDLAELAKLQTNLTSQLENLTLPADRRAQLQGMLDQVTARLATMSGISSTGPTGASVKYASNPKTGERIMSTDGGQTWKPAQ